MFWYNLGLKLLISVGPLVLAFLVFLVYHLLTERKERRELHSYLGRTDDPRPDGHNGDTQK